MSTDYEAAIWVSPRRLGGNPCIHGSRMPTAQVARIVWTQGVDAVHAGWPYFSDEQIMVACWFEVVHGDRRRWRRLFKDWPKAWDEDQWLSRWQDA